MLIFGLKVSLIGMGIVFFALILLVYMIKGFSRLSALYEKRVTRGIVEIAGAPVVPVILVRDVDGEDREELAALISAAVAAYRGDET
jgi:sodium pump decarboxylase gamma subunit